MKHLMMGFAACVLMMTSCTQQEITESVSDGQGQLNFSTGIGKQTTRAAEEMNSTLKGKAINAASGIALRTYQKTTAQGAVFEHWFTDDLSYDDNKKEWKIESTRFRNTAATKYITYFPKTYVTEVAGTFDAADFNATFPEFTCTIGNTSDAQEDLIAGITEVGANKTDIVLGMRHILSQVNFGTVGYKGANITIRNIVIKGLHDSGTFKYGSEDKYPIGGWDKLGTNQAEGGRDASYNYYNHTNQAATKNPQPTAPQTAVKGDVYIFGDGGNAGPGRKATTWYPTKEDVDRWENAPTADPIELENSLMLMPQDFKGQADAKVTFEYQITDVDGAYVAGGSGDVWEEGEFKLDFSTGSKEGEHYMAEWKQNYRYVYLIDFTDFLDGVALTFDVNVEMYPWENYDGDEGIVDIMAVGRPSAANMNKIANAAVWYIASQSEKDPTSFTPHYKWAQVMKDEIWDLSTYDFTKIAKGETVALNFKNVIFNTPDTPKNPTTITMTLPDGFSATPTTTSITVEAHTTLPNTWVIKGGDKSPNAVVTITNDNYYRNSATLKAGIEAVGVTNGTKFGYGGTEAIDLTEMEPPATLIEGNTITVKFNCLVVPTVGATASGHWTWDAAKQTATWTRVEWKDLTDAKVAFKGATANQIIYCSDATGIDLSVAFDEPTDPANTPVIVVFKTAAARTVQDTAGGKWSYNATTLTATWTRN